MIKPPQWLKSLYRRAWLENFGWHLVIRRFVIGASIMLGIWLIAIFGAFIGVVLLDYFQIPREAVVIGFIITGGAYLIGMMITGPTKNG